MKRRPSSPSAPHDRTPQVWLDVTTSWRERSGQSNGTLRVEGSYGAALSQIMGPRLHLSRYIRTTKRFLPVASLPKLDGNRSSGRHRSLGPAASTDAPSLKKIGRNIERSFRTLWRGGLGWAVQQLDTHSGTTPFSDARPGDVLLLAGETWSQYDFDVLRQLRRAHQLRLAAICQDLIPVKCPQYFESGAFVERFRSYADFLVSDVDLLLAISNSTKADILDHARLHGGIQGRLETIRLGADFDSAAVPEKPAALADLVPGTFVLSVSTLQSRKNFDLLYRLWQRFSAQRLPNLPRLVIVGRRGFGSADLLWQMSHDPLVEKSITVVHTISDSELSWLYKNCLWTLYPSFYEGWGLPVSESLAHGKYCLASDSSSLPEAGEGLIRHLDPLDFRSWQEAITELVGKPAILAEYEKRIASTYRPLGWLESAKRLDEKLQELLLRPTQTS
jgi:glycosyltransferase involved in cell wall biosynthesis